MVFSKNRRYDQYVFKWYRFSFFYQLYRNWVIKDKHDFYMYTIIKIRVIIDKKAAIIHLLSRTQLID